MPSPTASDDTVELLLGAEAPVDAAGAVARAAALHAGLGPDRATRLRAIVEELLREARSRECVGGAAELRIVSWVDEDHLVVEIHDRRLPLAPGGAGRLPSRRLAALGFVDRLRIAARGVDGNMARVEVRLDDPGADLSGTEVLAADVERASDEAAAALVVRPMEEQDAVGVVQCVYRCYGYTYLDPSMYRPRSLVARHRSGRLHSIVAVSPDGEVVGHCALTFDRAGAPVPEAGKLVVDPRYRGHHLSERLAEVRLATARQLGLSGIWAECVTNHPFSQKEFASFGGVETGLLIGAAPAAVTMEGLENAAVGRHSLLAMWAPVVGPAPGELHVAADHVELMAELVDRSGQTRTLRTGSSSPSTPHTHLHSLADPDAGVGHVRIDRIGTDLVDRVRDELDVLAAHELSSVQVDLPLADPAAGAAAAQLETLGCCFGAWLPGYAGGDVLRLQRVAPGPLATEIHCARPEGEWVRDAVLDQWRRVTR